MTNIKDNKNCCELLRPVVSNLKPGWFGFSIYCNDLAVNSKINLLVFLDKIKHFLLNI